MTIRLLLIEDNSTDAALTRDVLAAESIDRFEITHVVTLQEGLNRLKSEPFDAALLDLSLPDAHGIGTFTRTQVISPEIPIIVLSGSDNQALALQAVQEGAQDYLVKGATQVESLARAIRYAIERKRTQEQIKASLREKDVLLREIHHRVKNNLQILDSLLRLQAQSITEPHIVRLFEECHSRVRTIGLLYETLSRSRDLALVDMPEFIESIATNLFQSYAVSQSTIALHLGVDPVSMSIETAIPCGLIINELISNSLKHAFPEKTGSVSIELVSNPDETFTLIVQDTGVGLAAQVFKRQPPPLGLQLVAMLSEQLSGTAELQGLDGTKWTITFPPLVYGARF